MKRGTIQNENKSYLNRREKMSREENRISKEYLYSTVYSTVLQITTQSISVSISVQVYVNIQINFIFNFLIFNLSTFASDRIRDKIPLRFIYGKKKWNL